MAGVLIVSVLPGSPAEKAGLQPTRRDAAGQLHLGDIITAIDDKPVKSVNDLFAALERHKVGDTITVKVLRDGEPQDVPVTLEAVS